jgi:tRNA (guanine-N7-)-methyltransferase
MRVRVRNHVNPLGAGFQEFRGQRPVLAEGREVELEVGCADAQFLFERARRDPDRSYVGLEIREELVDAVNDAARGQGVPVQAIFCNANLHLSELFGSGTVDRAYVNFPDPWFKRRHEKRRMVDAELAEDISGILRPGGEVFVQTDVWGVALDALAAFDDAPGLSNAAGSWSFWKSGNPYGVRSWREQHCEKNELPVWRILYRKQALG